MKRILSAVLTLGLLVSILSACNQSDQSTQEEASTDAEPTVSAAKPAADDDEQIVLRYMTWEDGDWQNFTQEFVDKYMADNPNVTIQYEPTAGSEYMPKLRAALVAGNAPDVMWVDQWVDLYQNDMFLDLTPLADKQGYDLTAHNEEHLRMATYNDKLYGLTGWAGVFSVVYNKELFDEAGAPYPEYGWTWEDCYNAAAAITSGEGAEKIYGIALPVDYFNDVENFIWSNGARIIDDDLNYDGVMNSDLMVQSLTWYTDIIKQGYSPEPEALTALGGAEEVFKQGRIGMIYRPSGYIGAIMANNDFDLDKMGTVITPMAEAGMLPPVNTLLTNPISIAKNTEHPQEAFHFLTARVGVETQTDFCSRGWTMPNDPAIVQALGIMEDPLLSTYGDTLVNTSRYTYPRPTTAYSPMGTELDDAFMTVLARIILNDADPKEELDNAVEQVKRAEANK